MTQVEFIKSTGAKLMALQSRGQGTKAHSVSRYGVTLHGDGALQNEQFYFLEIL